LLYAVIVTAVSLHIGLRDLTKDASLIEETRKRTWYQEIQRLPNDSAAETWWPKMT